MSEANIEVLCERLDNLKEHITEKFKENTKAHEDIVERVNRTNGSVVAIKAWKIRCQTVLWVFGLGLAYLIVPVLIRVVDKYLTKVI